MNSKPNVAQCPCCGLQWEVNCEQHACIELFGECIACRFSPSGRGSRAGTMEDIDLIQHTLRQMLGFNTSTKEGAQQ